MLGKKLCFQSWRLCHLTVKTLHIWFVCDWLLKCKQTLCFLPLFTGCCGWVEGGLEVVWTERRAMWRFPLLCCRASWAVSSPFASLCWLISLQRGGTWLLNTFCASIPCSELLSNSAHQNFPRVAAKASHGRQSCVSTCGGTVPPWRVSLCRAP